MSQSQLQEPANIQLDGWANLNIELSYDPGEGGGREQDG